MCEYLTYEMICFNLYDIIPDGGQNLEGQI